MSDLLLDCHLQEQPCPLLVEWSMTCIAGGLWMCTEMGNASVQALPYVYVYFAVGENLFML